MTGVGLSQSWEEVWPLLQAFLAEATGVVFVCGDRQGTVIEGNQAAANLLGLELDDIVGRTVSELLTEADGVTFKTFLERGGHAAVLLNFVDVTDSPQSLRCHLQTTQTGFVLMGERVREREELLQRELIELNNSHAVVTREKSRQAKALEKARAQLQAALEELDQSYWHLRKIHEVLPICAVCGRVRSGDGEASWETVVEYLKNNSRFLSHGLCPDCLQKTREEWGLVRR